MYTRNSQIATIDKSPRRLNLSAVYILAAAARNSRVAASFFTRARFVNGARIFNSLGPQACARTGRLIGAGARRAGKHQRTRLVNRLIDRAPRANAREDLSHLQRLRAQVWEIRVASIGEEKEASSGCCGAIVSTEDKAAA